MKEVDYQNLMSELNWLLGLVEGAGFKSAVERLKNVMFILRTQVKTTKD
jgi:hypothetical protein